MSCYLQRHLSRLQLKDTSMELNSENLVEFPENFNPGACDAEPYDVEVLFDSIPHGCLFVAIRETIEAFEDVKFQNKCGIAVKGFFLSF